MSHALVTQNKKSGIVPALASAVLPGLGQLVNGETQKGIVIFLTCAIASASLIRGIPLVGFLASALTGLTWLYGVADAYLTGKRGPRR